MLVKTRTPMRFSKQRDGVAFNGRIESEARLQQIRFLCSEMESIVQSHQPKR
jgi:hypothetical protein